MDRHFPAPPPAPHLPLVVELVTDLLVEHGYAEIHGVPGYQQQLLRAQVRAKRRERVSEMIETGEVQVNQPQWRLYWDTWRTP